MKPPFRTLLLAPIMTEAGCTAPGFGYRAMPVQQAEAYRRYALQVVVEDMALEDSDRMSRAQAAELATRRALSSVSNIKCYAPSS